MTRAPVGEKSGVSKHWHEACQPPPRAPLPRLGIPPGFRPYATMLGRIRAGSSEGWRLAAHSLSGRLLLLTIFFVMIGEVLIFVPSVGQYYRELLGNHIESAELAVMPFTLPESNKLPETLRTQILQRAGAEAVLLTLAVQRFYFHVNDDT